MMFLNWIKSFFTNTQENNQTSINYQPISQIEPPYSLLSESTLEIKQVQTIQEIIEKYGTDFNTENPDLDIVQKAFDELISISSLDENLRLYLHELMFFSSIRMDKTAFYVELSKLIISNFQHLQSFVESQIFWCFDNFSDLYVYTSIEKNLLKEENLQSFEKSVISDIEFYLLTETEFNPLFRYLRFPQLYKNKKLEEINFQHSFFHSYYFENKDILTNSEYFNKMRVCVNTELVAALIREDKDDLIGNENIDLKANIIDRNIFLSFGCTLLHYAAFYGSKKCFHKLFPNFSEQLFEKKMTVETYPFCGKYYLNKYQMTLCDFACCGGNLDICKMILNKGLHFTSQSLQFSIRYHRNEVFNWLVNELNIKMDEKCYKASIQFEYIPGIELYQQYNEQINVNLELSKSGNYVLFCKFIKPDLIYVFNNKSKAPIYRRKYAPIMPIFYYNSVDCYRYIFSKKLDLNECSWFDSLNGPFRFGIPPDETNNQYRNPFHIAIKHQFLDLIKMILVFGIVDLNSTERLSTVGGVGTLCLFNGKALPPLEIAINTDNSDLVQFLLSIEEIDVNKAPSIGGGSSYSMGSSDGSLTSSIIREAALRGNLEILEILLKSPRIDKNSICHIHSSGYGYSSFNDKDENMSVLQGIQNKDVLDLLSRYGIK